MQRPSPNNRIPLSQTNTIATDGFGVGPSSRQGLRRPASTSSRTEPYHLLRESSTRHPHATFGATNTAVKQTDWSPVAPFCGEGVAHLRHKPTKFAEIHGGALIPSNSTPRPNGALHAAALLSLAHAIASSLIAKHRTHGHIGTQWEATNTVTSRWATNAKQPQAT